MLAFYVKKKDMSVKNCPIIKKRTTESKADPSKGAPRNPMNTVSMMQMDGIGTTPPPSSNPPTTSMDNPTRGRTSCETSASNLNISNPSQGCANVSPLLPAQTTPPASVMDIIKTPPEDGFQIAISKKR